ncbi:MAG: 7TM diverse intracellular signaling domain-containing protein [Mucilaginibacter sp.]|uniref:7TM diverse intracellular signaling domain-containing protein n=1 Tax=Mucilaginibacter sp. TaxID=1882438 RepID=UPI0031AE6124
MIRLKTFFILIITFGVFQKVIAQRPVEIGKNDPEHIFTYDELSLLEDSSGRMTFDMVRQKDKAGSFKANTIYYPKNIKHHSAYWYKVKINFSSEITSKQSLFEFYDQTTGDIIAFLPDAKGNYEQVNRGADKEFTKRLYHHKNLEFLIPEHPKGTYIYYFRIKSAGEVNVIIVYRTVERFINYALAEYITYGFFYGMILVFSLHNLLMFFATGLKQYLFYVLYMLSVGIYEMSVDGIAFQFIWPGAPVWNQYAYGIALYGVSIFALLFTRTLLHLKQYNLRLYRFINITIIIRTVYFIFCFTFKREWFVYKFWEFIPLSIAFLAGIMVWMQGFKPARFFVIGYTFLFAGAIMKLITVLGFATQLPGAVGHYSMTMGFVLEMTLLSFSIGDQVRLFRTEKDTASKWALHQMNLNMELQGSINQRLEDQVAERTRELVAQARHIEEQANEIARMNLLLENDNVQLKTDIEKMTEARMEATDLSFEEFSQKYPDREHCYQLLADLKWKNGFECKRCAYTHYSEGRRPFSRRCNKCAYEESPMQDTIFENNRIPINKAFYIVYILFATKGKISSYKIAEQLDIRQGTCWTYAIRINAIIEQQKPALGRNKNSRWIDLILKAGN